MNKKDKTILVLAVTNWLIFPTALANTWIEPKTFQSDSVKYEYLLDSLQSTPEEYLGSASTQVWVKLTEKKSNKVSKALWYIDCSHTSIAIKHLTNYSNEGKALNSTDPHEPLRYITIPPDTGGEAVIKEVCGVHTIMRETKAKIEANRKKHRSFSD